MKAKWYNYLRLKQVAKDLFKQKMAEKEKADILREMKTGGGYNSRFFWSRAQWKKGKRMSKIRDESGAVATDEEAIADVARAHFESLGRGSR